MRKMIVLCMQKHGENTQLELVAAETHMPAMEATMDWVELTGSCCTEKHGTTTAQQQQRFSNLLLTPSKGTW
jgi:hypothetical protein